MSVKTPLRRLGNKQKLAEKIISYFPSHTAYVEMFFGAGAIMFAKKPAKYSFANDLDQDVFNFWKVCINPEQKARLINIVEQTPIDRNIFNYLRKETFACEITQAFRFVYLSNYSFMGKMNTCLLECGNSKKILIKNLQYFTSNLQSFTCLDFRKVLGTIGFQNDPSNILVYADPPYLNTENTYNTGGWEKQDTVDLLQIAKKSEANFCVSEYSNKEVIEIANDLNLNVIYLSERRNLSSDKKVTEILITNYKLQNTLF